MKTKSDFLLREIGDNIVVVPVGDKTLNFNGIINLNETGAFLWNLMQSDVTKEDLIKKMLDEYNTDVKTAESDIDIFINKLKDAELLE